MLRGASAEARAELESELGTSGTMEDTAALGDNLLAAAGVVQSEPALRRVLTDASIEGEAKAGLAADVFSGKVGEQALDLVKVAVQQRWTSSRDLAGVLEELGIQAVVRSAGAQGARVSDELFAVAQLVDAHPDLRGALSDPARSHDDKTALLGSVLEGKVLPATLRLVAQALRRDEPVGRALESIQRVAADVQDELLAVVHTARPLGATEITRLTQALGKAYDTTVHLHVVEDPELIGGLRVEIGDDVIDGSVVSKLDSARRRIAG
jgi:F-type H+-transporting ATPase subunit delta